MSAPTNCSDLPSEIKEPLSFFLSEGINSKRLFLSLIDLKLEPFKISDFISSA